LEAKNREFQTAGNDSIAIVYFVKTKFAVGSSKLTSLDDENDARGEPWCATTMLFGTELGRDL
jgi:hypothetical protein